MIGKRYLTGGINGTTHAYNDTTPLVGFTTAFDRAGNKLYERHLHAESRSHLYQPFNTDGSFGVGYDSANRLMQYQRGALSSAIVPFRAGPGASIDTPITLPGTNQIRTYNLDGLGNWKSGNLREVGDGGSTTDTAEVRQHNYVNEINSIKETTGGTTTPTACTYDANGNLLSDGVRTYEYDEFNRLSAVIMGSSSTNYGYDAFDRLLFKQDEDGGIPYYLYDGAQVVEEHSGDDDFDYDELIQVYFWGQYVDELLFFIDATTSTTYRVLSDLLYRSVAMVTTVNVITEAYDCDAYGNTLCYSGPGTDGIWFTDDDVQTDDPINTTIFTGRLYDPVFQFYYYRARFYSPLLGRFLTRRPLPDAELSQGPNLYWYVQNNPIDLVDPMGFAGTWDVEFLTSNFSNTNKDAVPEVNELSQYTLLGRDFNLPVTITYHPDKKDCCKFEIKIIQYVNGELDAPDPSIAPFYPSNPTPDGGRYIQDAPGTNPTYNIFYRLSSILTQEVLGAEQDFQTCALCVGSSEQRVLGCTYWSRTFSQISGQSHQGQGGRKPSSPGNPPIPF